MRQTRGTGKRCLFAQHFRANATRSMRMERHVRYLLRAGLIVGVLAALVAFRPDRALHVASGLTAQLLCSATFVSNLDPDKTFAETVRPMTSVAGPLLWYSVDHRKTSVSASVLGLLTAKAVYHPGYGCRQEYADSVQVPPALPEKQTEITGKKKAA